MSRPVVLLADDDDGVRFTLSEVLSELDVDVLEAPDGEIAVRLLQKQGVDLVITDLRMPKVDGMALLERVQKEQPKLPVVMITAHGSEAAAVQAMKLGAFDYFPKPFEVDQVVHVVTRALETVRLSAENRRLLAALALSRHMIFHSEAMLRVAHIVERASARDVTVLITGESGTGKELVANALVAGSSRVKAPFVKFNCAALPREVAEDELFGHKIGAFTGAVDRRQGLFRAAHGGTIFLDEVGELEMAVQSKLLRVLQEGAVRPVGEDTAVEVDVRVLAATHRDLEEEVRAGRFREDLYFRLNVVRVHLPPLRDRPEDIEPLIDFFMTKYTERFSLSGARLSSRARNQLLARSYPGNVRELENAVERLVALSTGDVVDELDASDEGHEAPLSLKDRVDAFERGLIVSALEAARWNRSEAARRLGVGRVTLLDKMKRFGLKPTEE